MIDYELAKTLKDAGFPGMDEQRWAGRYVYPEEPTETAQGNLITHGEPIKVASLEELIEACLAINPSFNLNYYEGVLKYCAASHYWPEECEHHPDCPCKWKTRRTFTTGKCKSASEAVARLWIDLKNK